MRRSLATLDGSKASMLRRCALTTGITHDEASACERPGVVDPAARGRPFVDTQRASRESFASACPARNPRRFPVLRGWSNMANARSRASLLASAVSSS